MIICICHRVSDHDIARSVREGCTSFDELQAELAVATGCGACHDCAQASFHELSGRPAPARPVSAAANPPVAQPVFLLRRARTLHPAAGLRPAGGAGVAAASN